MPGPRRIVKLPGREKERNDHRSKSEDILINKETALSRIDR